MSDQVAYLDDLLLEDCLDEVFHGGPSPELAQRILTAAGSTNVTAGLEVREASTGQDPTPALSSVEGPTTALRTVPLDPDTPISLPRWAIWLAQGAVAAGLIILLVVLVFPRDPDVPSGVIAAHDAEFEYDPAVQSPQIRAGAGWYLLSDGAPPLTAAASRVEDVKGTVIVKVGDIPNPDELAAMQPWLDQHQVEAQMSGNWIKAGALSLLIVSGSAFVDGQYLSAQEVKKERKEAEVKKEGEVKKERADGDEAARAERVAAELEKLREEIKDLEKRLEEARDLEDGREKSARIERIENALKDKRERIAEIENKIAGENDKKRDEDAAAKKRREAERRKNAEKDDDAAARERKEAERRKNAEKDDDAAARERKEAERRKNAEKDADNDAAAKERREAERRKKAEGETKTDEELRKAREEAARKKAEEAERRREKDKREQ